MAFAADGGHMDIVQSMLIFGEMVSPKTKPFGEKDYNTAMAFAAGGGHMNIVLFMLNKGEIAKQSPLVVSS